MKNKLAYIGHSYHLKTRSTSFLIDLLQSEYEVDYIPNTSWENDKIPDLSEVDDRYSAVVLFQLVSEELLEQLKHKNITYIPMFDGVAGIGDLHSGSVGVPLSFWKSLDDHNVKILNFSSALNDICRRLGLHTHVVRYFPKPGIMTEAKDKMSIFFWQRLKNIDLDFVLRLIGEDFSRLHYHCAPDPGHTITRRLNSIDPSRISITNWFENNNDYLRAVSACDVYICPRPVEGIGMSFLEAMAMGKAVVSANLPTMNEYILNNNNGYLYDLQNPTRIDFTNFRVIGENAYRSIEEGYKTWLMERSSILDWVKEDTGIKRDTFIKSYSLLGFPSWLAPKYHSLSTGGFNSDAESKLVLRIPKGLAKQIMWFLRYIFRSRGIRRSDLVSGKSIHRIWNRVCRLFGS